TVVANIEKDHAIPPVERQVAVGCAVQNLILLAEAAGFGTYWRTGPMAYDAVVKRGLGLSESEEIIAFVYVGTAAGEVPKRSIQSVTQVTQRWSGGKPQAWV
ncbi:MAG: nitroreductase family protein, partial [Gammaproteobacteria bacterium]